MQYARYLSIIGLFFSLSVYAKVEQIDREYTVNAGDTLLIDSSSGTIDVQRWNKKTVYVEVKKSARNKSDLDDYRVLIEQKNNTVSVQGIASGDSWGGWGAKVSVAYKVKVPTHFNLELNTGGGAIKVGNLSGAVNAKTSGGSITVGDIDGDLNVDTSGGSISVGKVSGESKISTSGGSIKVAGGGASVVAKTSGGSIKIGPSNGRVSVDTSGGSILVGHAKGDVSADTSGGSIRIEGSDGNVLADTSGGGVYIDNVAGKISADTSGGGIRISRARGAVKADTSGGDIRVEFIEHNPKVDTSISLETSGGEIELYLPEKMKASVLAVLEVHFHNKKAQIYSDFPLTIKRSNGKILGEGDINGGGDPLRMRTNNGSIYIRKLEQ